jgi:hypothetical protein
MVQIPYGGVVGGVVTQHATIVGRNVEEVARNVEQVANEDGDSEPVESAVIPRKHGGHVVTTAPEEQEEQEEPVATEMTARVVTTAPEEQEGPTPLTWRLQVGMLARPRREEEQEDHVEPVEPVEPVVTVVITRVVTTGIAEVKTMARVVIMEVARILEGPGGKYQVASKTWKCSSTLGYLANKQWHQRFDHECLLVEHGVLLLQRWLSLPMEEYPP